MSNYEIYPIPQNIRYTGKKLELSDQIKLNLDENIDEVNLSKLHELLSKKNLNVSDDSGFEISIKKNVNLENFDHYILNITENNIYIEFKDNDALFYALETLKIIFSQSKNLIDTLEINDFADVKYRGIIEGFYGIPWSWEDKIELLKFGSKFKNNLFIYAPKDDPYHRDKWRQQYPESDLEKLKIMAEYGRKYKNRFVYTIAPFKKDSQAINEENFEESIIVLINKLEQLYKIGIRQFGVLADDVGKLPHSVVVDVMTKLSEWKKQKNDLYDFLFCPGSYVLTWAWDAEELNAYTEGFPEDVHIFFTGRNTCTSVNKKDVDEFKTKEISEEFSGKNTIRRDPFFWLNWPVNDIDADYRKLYIGKGEMLEKDVDNIVGLVTNPMQEANASKIAIFAVSDYSWNMKKFDSNKSWQDSFKYIDKFAYEELNIIASHMSNQDAKGIVGLEESEDFKELQKQFSDSMNDMLVSEVKDVLYKIKNEFEYLVNIVDRFFAKSKEKNLVKEVEPFFLAFKNLLLSGIYYIDAFMALEEGQKEIGQKLYNIASMYYEKYPTNPIASDPKTNRRMSLSETSTLRIKPIISKLKDYLDRPFERNRNISKAEKFFYRGLDNSKSYRIPALLYSKDGTMLAFADKRNEHQYDWGNIDLVVRRKEKNDKEYCDSIVVIDPVDQDGGQMPDDVHWPVDLKVGDKSAFVIDPLVVQGKDGTIFAFTTAFPESKGFFSIKEAGSGYIIKNKKKYLALYSKDGEKFYLKENKIFTFDNKETEYTVIIKKQIDGRIGDILDKEGNFVDNIFLKNDKFFMQETSHIIMKKSTDDGKTWSEAVDLNPQIKEEWMKFFGVAPGRGLTLENGRILVPTYFTNEFGRQSSCFIYSDDNGDSWHRGQSVNHARNVDGEIIDDKSEFDYFYQTGECQAVQLDNGDIKLFVRNQFHGRPVHIQIATSKDNGETFEDELEIANIESQSNCQLSLVHTHHNGKEYVLMTAPSTSHTNERHDGKIFIGKVEDGNIDFYKSKIISYGLFWYSSLEEDIEKKKFTILYEGGDSLNHNDMDMMMREFSWQYLLEEENLMRYTIYPKPQEINYLSRSTYLDKPFKIIFDNNVDKYNRQSLVDIIEEAGYKTSNDDNHENIKIDVKFDGNLKEINQYKIEIIENNINIIGSSNDAVYYAYMTLSQILDQSDGTIRNISINDFANQKIRGAIEGYYGIPYSTEKRKDMMIFSSKFKANVFVYAPKDDPYHREKWDQLYPDNLLKDFEMLGKLGDRIKTRFIWTISPFKKDSNPISEENFDQAIVKLLNKLDQVYQIGIRQFGVLGDDVGELPKNIVVKVMHAVSDWAKTKSDKVYDFIFVPEGYVLAEWGFRPDEIDVYSKEFPEDVQIMFTGENTCAPITQSSIDGFKYRQTKIGERRNPLFWLNWPVNDIDRTTHRRIFMGKGEMLEVGVKNIVGTITNTLEEAYASYPAVFAISDYAWNTNDFNAQKSWEDSFKFIEKEAYNELHEIAKHMSNADNGGIEGLEESEDMKEIIGEFEKNIDSNNIFEYRYPLITLKSYYQNITDCIEIYFEKAENKKLSQEIKPYVNNLLKKSKSAISLLESYRNLKENNLALAKENLEKGEILLEESEMYTVNTKTAEFDAKELIACSGSLRINKNINNLIIYLKEKLNNL